MTPIKFTRLSTSLVALLAAISFSGSAIADEPPGHKEEHKHAFAKDVAAFHAVLAPLWHAPAGKARSENICAQTPTMANLANAIQSSDAKALQAALATLKEKCQTSPTDTDTAFSAVHDAFHHLEKH